MTFSFELMAECHGHAVIYNHYISHSMAAFPEEPVNHLVQWPQPQPWTCSATVARATPKRSASRLARARYFS